MRRFARQDGADAILMGFLAAIALEATNWPIHPVTVWVARCGLVAGGLVLFKRMHEAWKTS